MLHFTTYFDKNYLSRGIVLYNSLKENCNDFELYILCLDEFTENYFKTNHEKYRSVKTILLSDIEDTYDELKECKNNRSTIEYYFTLSPCLPLYLLKKFNLSHICSLDADILFLANPAPLFDYLKQYSIVITPHKFSPEIKQLLKYGIYNVSFQIFKNDDIGISCLELWKQQCLEWCSDVFDEENNRFADQKYLDNWTAVYPEKVKELYDNFSGLAPWNLNNYELKLTDNLFYSNNERLIFYHFHHFKLLSKNWSANGFSDYMVNNYSIPVKLYLYYWNKLDEQNQQLHLENDFSKRINLSQKLIVKLLKENSLFYKWSDQKMIYISNKKIPSILKRIIFKLYA
jgi:hypothetical protein